MLGEDPEPSPELLPVPVRSREERDPGARGEVAILALVRGVVREELTNRAEPGPVVATIEPADHVVVQATSVRERLGQAEALTLGRDGDVADRVVHEVHGAVAGHGPGE